VSSISSQLCFVQHCIDKTASTLQSVEAALDVSVLKYAFLEVVNLAKCLFLLKIVSWINTFWNHIFKWSLYRYIFWLRIFGNMSSYLSILICINERCSRANTQQIWIQTDTNRFRKDVGYAVAWTRISRTNIGCLNHATTPA
jgi:hypothetical protein